MPPTPRPTGASPRKRALPCLGLVAQAVAAVRGKHSGSAQLCHQPGSSVPAPSQAQVARLAPRAAERLPWPIQRQPPGGLAACAASRRPGATACKPSPPWVSELRLHQAAAASAPQPPTDPRDAEAECNIASLCLAVRAGSSAEASACEALDGCDSGSAPEPLLPAQPPSARPGIVAFAMRTGERPDPHASDAPIARAIAASATAGSSALTAEMPQPSAAGTPLTAAAAPVEAASPANEPAPAPAPPTPSPLETAGGARDSSTKPASADCGDDDAESAFAEVASAVAAPPAAGPRFPAVVAGLAALWCLVGALLSGCSLPAASPSDLPPAPYQVWGADGFEAVPAGSAEAGGSAAWGEVVWARRRVGPTAAGAGRLVRSALAALSEDEDDDDDDDAGAGADGAPGARADGPLRAACGGVAGWFQTTLASQPGLVLVTAAVARATAVALSPAAGLAAKVADAAPAPLPGLVLSALEQVPKLVSPAAEGWLVWVGLLGGAAARVASDALACVAAAVVGASVVGAMQ